MALRRVLISVICGLVLIIGGWFVWEIGLNVYDVDETITAKPTDCGGDIHFAIIGDFGDAGQPEADVAALVDSWNVDFVVTVGDNNYPNGEASTIDENIGQYYQAYIYPYHGSYGAGSSENRFFPALGNHDWRTDSVQPHLDYFTLPGNERYYAIKRDPVHLFIVDSDPHEPDGRHQASIQAKWFEGQMVASDAAWQLVFLHDPPYASSATRGDDEEMQWPFAEWGADIVIGGHHHFYERLEKDGFPYIINGLGGRSNNINSIYRFLSFSRSPYSRVRYNQDYGAILVTVNPSCINFSFYDRQRNLIDSLTLSPGNE